MILKHIKRLISSNLLVKACSDKLRPTSRVNSTMTQHHVKVVLEDGKIIKSSRDDRTYRALELTNGMRVLLVSDPSTDKSSAAMDVNIGHMKDPKDIPGLAHFCEHMLFLGTKKYPEENEYTKFLNEHGGSSNAFTSNEHTNFFFDVAPDNLEGALDRFAQFFLCPLFTECATEREINAVNSENDKNLQNDGWRFHQLDKSLADPSHDYSKFGTGNKETLETMPKKLGYDVREELLKFHDQNYSSNLMGMVVLGKESPDELQKMVVPLISEVENKNLPVPEWTTPPFGEKEVRTVCYVVPVKDIRNLSVSWSIPDLHEHYKTNPGHYLGHLIGHEGAGSLLSELKARGWVNTLVGGQQGGAKGFMFFMVNVDLTEDGLEHVDDIITLIYQYINMLKNEGPQEWVFKECQNLSAMQFRFKDKERPRNYTSSLAAVLHQYSLNEVLCASYLMTEYKPELINMVVDKLIPESMRISVVAKKYEGQTNNKEKWYGTSYKLENIPDEKLKKWKNCGLNEKLRFPDKNEFIPTNFDLSIRDQEIPLVPEVIKDTSMTRLWFRQDDKFLMPKAFASFEITSPIAYIDPVHANMTTLFSHLFKDALNEYAYAAEIAGLRYNLLGSMYGISLTVKGYSDKLFVLLTKIVEKLATFQIDPKRYEILMELYKRSLKNFHAEQPHQHALYYTSVLMAEVLWTQEELLQALDELSLEKLQAFIPQLLSKLYIEGLIYGNITRQQGLKLTEVVESTLKEKCHTKTILPSQHRRVREVQLPNGCYYLYQKTNSVHKSSSIDVYYQCGMQETQSNTLLELFLQIISEPCFSILRTKEQLGYIVFSGLRRSSGVQGLRVIVQSDYTPDYVEGRVEAFLASMNDYIGKLTEEEFQKHVAALATKRLEKPKKMTVQNDRYWAEIISQQYNFDRDNIEVAFLKTISKEDLHKFYKDKIAHDAPGRHKLSIHVLSTVESPNGPKVTPEPNEDGQSLDLLPVPQLPKPVIVEDITLFKRELGLYPLAKPYIDLKKAHSKL
ncbi:hypothetical protein ACJMK2_005374 [Sinanodonta woodiana]|uniref:Insulin-degrading enzyme n=1 Tax=Sinanodonta woodiana TaxID=1069815 RepID=A0ABD3VPU2_SINWO